MEELQTADNYAKLEGSLREADVSHDVRRLNSSILEMKDAFRKLSSSFALHDCQVQEIDRQSGGSTPVPPLKPRWDKLRERFTVLLDSSHANARKASATLKQYVNLFTDSNIKDSRNYEALRKEIDNLLTVVQSRIKCAQGAEDSFASLANNIRDFEGHVHNAIMAVKAQSKVVYQALEESSDKVRVLRCQLAKASDELVELGITLITCLSTGAISAGMLFLKFSPETAQTVVTSLISSFSPAKAASMKLVETIKLKKSLRESERTLAAMQRRFGAVKFLEDSLLHAAHSMDTLAGRVDALSDIWYLLKTDMCEIRSELCRILDGTPPSQMFAQKLRVTRGVYRRLIETLDIYARGTAL
ncbi:hypothetical protein PYCCODRAFT_1432725 [Trametes coccinea BRFM310]|uniref:Uncharacterized protein n=1 Tax=Trametes coccinea (strain BRFM310) TaxID=1353009 RepID=A0A1Y2IV70_TRAC3|nr:hypothetical protein PYCCODRAFT_1432725 [Trametes coccinea BRFM310]